MLLKGISPIQKQDNRTKNINTDFEITDGISLDNKDNKQRKGRRKHRPFLRSSGGSATQSLFLQYPNFTN